MNECCAECKHFAELQHKFERWKGYSYSCCCTVFAKEKMVVEVTPGDICECFSRRKEDDVMKYEVALDNVQQWIFKWEKQQQFVFKIEPLRAAASALRKQIGKPAIKGEGTLLLCPVCKKPLLESHKHCAECGQKIERRKSEE